MAILDQQVAIPTPKQVAGNAELFAATFLKVLDKTNHLVPLRWNRVQRHLQANRTGRDLVLKARQIGISTFIQGEMFRRAVTGSRSTITLAHDADTTAKLRLMADRFWEYCSFGGVRPLRKYANSTLTTYPEFESAVSIATAGNIDAGRGGSYSDFHGSEVAFWKDAERIIAGALQGGSPDAVLESTPNGAQGYFYERCMEAQHGDGIWRLHFYPWWWDDEYRVHLAVDELLQPTAEEERLAAAHSLDAEQLKWRRNKIKELRGLFQQEYPEDPITCFLTSGNSYFGDMTGVYTAPQGAEYDPAHKYVAGLDFGQTNDFTAMPVFDVTAKVQVDLLHINKLSWAEQRRRIAETYRKWHCSRLGAEANSIGSVNIEALQAPEIGEDGKEIHPGMVVFPFDTTNASKAEIMSDYYEALHTDGLKLLDIPAQMHEHATFVSTQTSTGMWRLAAEGEGHDDIVIANAIGWWMATAHIGWLVS